MYHLKQGTAIDSDRSLDKCFFVIDRSQAKLSEEKNENKKQKKISIQYFYIHFKMVSQTSKQIQSKQNELIFSIC